MKISVLYLLCKLIFISSGQKYYAKSCNIANPVIYNLMAIHGALIKFRVTMLQLDLGILTGVF